MAGKSTKRPGFAGNLFWALMLTIFIFTLSVVLVLNFKWLYYIDILLLGLEKRSGMSADAIRANYDTLIRYNQFWYHGDLVFPTLFMSNTGRIHFQEVKRIFAVIQYLCMGSFLLSVIGMIRYGRRRSASWLRTAGILTLAIPAVLGILAAVNWDAFFVAFHKLFFRNNYWLFDSRTDPVILILPDAYFLHCAVLILLLVLLGSLLCFLAYRRRSRKLAAANAYRAGRRRSR
ncbi:MAG: TIGR01906 family membrane protein [Lachnospiraceae bacterium]|nr:TIGR01906 family membrane protein [Lachnospiraceae bacterium]